MWTNWFKFVIFPSSRRWRRSQSSATSDSTIFAAPTASRNLADDLFEARPRGDVVLAKIISYYRSLASYLIIQWIPARRIAAVKRDGKTSLRYDDDVDDDGGDDDGGGGDGSMTLTTLTTSWNLLFVSSFISDSDGRRISPNWSCGSVPYALI